MEPGGPAALPTGRPCALVQEQPRKGIDRLFKQDKSASAEASADKKDEGGKVTVEE